MLILDECGCHDFEDSQFGFVPSRGTLYMYECENLLQTPINQITQTSLSINFNYIWSKLIMDLHIYIYILN